MSKVLIEVETTSFEDGAILVFDKKSGKFKTMSIEELTQPFLKGLAEKQQLIDAEKKASKEMYLSRLNRLDNLLEKIEEALKWLIGKQL